MRVLFLGGTTLNGPYAVRRLYSLGRDVTVFHRGEHRGRAPAGVRHLHGDFAHLPREIYEPASQANTHLPAKTNPGKRLAISR